MMEYYQRCNIINENVLQAIWGYINILYEKLLLPYPFIEGPTYRTDFNEPYSKSGTIWTKIHFPKKF